MGCYGSAPHECEEGGHLGRIGRLLCIWFVGLVEMMRFNLRQVNGGERHVGSS